MSHSKRRKTRKKWIKKLHKSLSARKPDEIVQLGPVTVSRFGRVLQMKSNLDEKSHKEYMEQLKNARPEFKNDIDEMIDKLANLIKTHDPLVLLNSLAISNLFADPETYKEITHKGFEPKVEFFMSIATAYPYADKPKEIDAGLFEEIDCTAPR